MLIKIFLFILQESLAQSLHQKEIAASCTTNLTVYKDIENASYVIGGLFPVHVLSTKNNISSYKYNSPGLMWIEAMTYAIQEINNSTKLLPNVKLGYQIHDTCNTIRTAIEASLRLTRISRQNLTKSSSNATCPCNESKSSVIAVIGDDNSASSMRVSSLLAGSYTAQISYSSTSTDLSAKQLYPTFLRTIPPDNFQAYLITDLIKHFQWRYVNVIACDDNYGRVGVKALQPALEKHNVCTGVFDMYDVISDKYYHLINQTIQKLIDEKETKTIILWCQRPEALKILRIAQEMKLYDRTWISTEAYANASELLKINKNVIQGMFGIIAAQESYEPFENYLDRQKSDKIRVNPFLHEYWLTKRNCREVMGNYTCPEKNLSLLQLPKNKYVNVMNGVYAIAHALHNYLQDNRNNKAFEFENRILLEYVKNVSFTGKNNISVSFDKSGNPAGASYSLVNLQFNNDGNASHKIVGKWNFRTRQIFFNKAIQFSNNSATIPTSSCRDHCLPGYRGMILGNRPCCWKCVKCTAGTIPNKNQTKCIHPYILRIALSTPKMTILAALSIAGAIVILLSIIILIHYRTTPVAKALNIQLSILQLISMFVLTGLPLVCFLGQVTEIQCIVQLYYFTFFYSIAISVTFAKADRLLKIFNASKSGILRKRSCIKSNKMQYIKVTGLTAVGTFVITTLYLASPPKMGKIISHTNDSHIKVEYFCMGNYDTILFILLGYNSIIALICGVYAFKARKLPETYNEAKYTSFAMFIFLLCWLMFIPIYFSATSKLGRVILWCYISQVVNIIIFMLMYLPKLCTIIFKPKENTPDKFREKMRAQTLSEDILLSGSNVYTITDNGLASGTSTL